MRRISACVAICPEAAVIHQGMDMAQFKDVSNADQITEEQLVKGVEAYRENQISWERLRTDPPTEGYVVRGS